jgi:hypothetical protein
MKKDIIFLSKDKISEKNKAETLHFIYLISPSKFEVAAKKIGIKVTGEKDAKELADIFEQGLIRAVSIDDFLKSIKLTTSEIINSNVKLN